MNPRVLPASCRERNLRKALPTGLSAAPCWRHRPTCSTFMVPTHVKKRKGAFHELSEAPPGFGVGCRSCFPYCSRLKGCEGDHIPPHLRPLFSEVVIEGEAAT